MGKQLYFTKEELGYIRLVFSNIDAVQDEEEEKLRDSVYRKVTKSIREKLTPSPSERIDEAWLTL